MFSKSLDNKGTYTKDNNILKDLTESIFRLVNHDLNYIYSYYRVSKELEMRPDKISKSLYGSENYAEIIMKHSNIDNPFTIEEGDILVAPSLTTIYNNIKDVKDYETADNDRDMSTYDLIKNYHKYIDKSKIPNQIGSENIDLDISKDAADNFNNIKNVFGNGANYGITRFDEFGNPINDDNSNSYNSYNSNNSDNINTSISASKAGEANLANNGKSGITIKNGRIYFGKDISASTDNPADIEGSNKVNTDLVDCAKDGITMGQFLNALIKNNIKNSN